MGASSIVTAIGTMSGTSFDGVDVAIIKTDGENIFDLGEYFYLPYPEVFRQNIRKVIEGEYSSSFLLEVENEITLYHAQAISKLLKLAKITKENIDLIGFHGQSIFHDARACKTWQLANPSLLAELTGIDVVADFRVGATLAIGGEGAPLVPLFHKAIFRQIPKPIAVLNIGGVGNITYLGEEGEVLAFDTGPGCALIDDWTSLRAGLKCDLGGKLAATGTPNLKRLDALMSDSYFYRKPPKSLDRNHFSGLLRKLYSLSNADGAATLAHFTAKSIVTSLAFLPKAPSKWIVSGGGRHNNYLMNILEREYKLPICNIDNLALDGLKLNGDYPEAQAFGFLAARSYFGLPISLPSTTGAVKASSGGGLYRRASKEV